MNTFWIESKNRQDRYFNVDFDSEIMFSFFKPEGNIEHFTTTYNKLYKIFKRADERFYSNEPIL